MQVLTRSLFIALTAAAFSTAAAAQTKWDMPTPYGDGTFHTKNVRAFAEDVKKATGGKLEITVHSAGSLVKHPEIKASVRRGVAPIGEILISLHSNESPIFGVDSVPFLASGYDQARKLYAAQRPFLEKKLGEDGLMLLYSVPWPSQGIYAKKEIKSLDDLKGLRFRTYNPATQRIAALTGAIPTQVEVPDIPTAFATNRVESMITSPTTGVDSKVWDFLTHFHHTQAWLPRNVVIVQKAAFDKLSDAEKKAVTDAAKAAEERGWKMSEGETGAKLKELADNKIIVVQPSDALKKGFAEVGVKMTEEWQQSAGADGKALLDAYRK
ncbi:MAG: TRAP transporter substrate-binding protein [Bradyrhizobiaceae bacterium]|nr:TRAP transporter substrate-binding protein [Bradyrhizobiaceae bacterium]